MNYAQLAQRYWDLAEQEELGANWREEQIYNEELSRLENRRQWNLTLRNDAKFLAYVKLRVQGILERDDEYKSHIGMQQHYLRKATAAAEMAHLHGQVLYTYESADGEEA